MEYLLNPPITFSINELIKITVDIKEDLSQKTLEIITHKQIKKFKVDGESIRMGSKLFDSNIA